MYTHIFVAIDSSQVSDVALRHAIGLAKDQGAQLHIAHVIDILDMTWAMPDILDTYREQGQILLNRALDLARQASVPATTSLLETGVVGNRPAEVLTQRAQEVSADLVVLGSHGYRGLSHFFLGSVAEGVARLSRAPVLIVHGSGSSSN
ncbi:MAG: universal stress protein [Thiomonas sp.]